MGCTAGTSYVDYIHTTRDKTINVYDESWKEWTRFVYTTQNKNPTLISLHLVEKSLGLSSG